jgi:hypothetical protein
MRSRYLSSATPEKLGNEKQAASCAPSVSAIIETMSQYYSMFTRQVKKNLEEGRAAAIATFF